MTTNSQLSKTESKKNKNTLIKLQQEKNHRNGQHMQGNQQGRTRGTMWGIVQGLRSIIGRYKIDRGLLRIIQEMEKPKNLYAQPMDMN